MQLAINVIIFVLGFLFAGIVGTKPKETRTAFDGLFKNLRFVLDAFRPGAPSTAHKLEESEIQQIVTQEGPELLTK